MDRIRFVDSHTGGEPTRLVLEGFSAMTSVGRPNSPIDMGVIGVIDRVDLLA